MPEDTPILSSSTPQGVQASGMGNAAEPSFGNSVPSAQQLGEEPGGKVVPDAQALRKAPRGKRAARSITAAAAPQIITVAPMASRARPRRRHYGLLISLLLIVAFPVLLSAVYLWAMAEDQYASTAGFTIRQEESGSASQLLGGLSQLAGGSNGNSDLLFEFIQSQMIVEEINQDIDLVAHYSATWSSDPVFSIWPDASIEDLHWFWRRVARISHDGSTGLIMIEVRARDPHTAQALAEQIVERSENMINLLNAAARRDSMANAERDLAEALERFRSAREAIAVFRARTQIIDPVADIQGRMGVLHNLQQQLAQALVDADILLQTTDLNDPRTRTAERRIAVIRDRIIQERLSFAEQDVTVDGTDYPRLLSQFESLRVDEEFAQENYRATLLALDGARSNAERQQIYLATFVRPTLSQRSGYPQRLLLVVLTGFFALMIWSVLALVYYSLRDRG